MNHAAICIRLQIYVRENQNDEERNQEGCQKDLKEGRTEKEEVTTTRVSGNNEPSAPGSRGRFYFWRRELRSPSPGYFSQTHDLSKIVPSR